MTSEEKRTEKREGEGSFSKRVNNVKIQSPAVYYASACSGQRGLGIACTLSSTHQGATPGRTTVQAGVNLHLPLVWCSTAKSWRGSFRSGGRGGRGDRCDARPLFFIPVSAVYYAVMRIHMRFLRSLDYRDFLPPMPGLPTGEKSAAMFRVNGRSFCTVDEHLPRCAAFVGTCCFPERERGQAYFFQRSGFIN